MMNDPSTLLHTMLGPEAAFRPGQAEAIEALLAGQNALVVMPTGAGKSLIYQIAGFLSPGLAIVISPLIALMKDQVDGLRAGGFPATFINSTLPAAEQQARLADVAAGRVQLLYAAPERLRHRAFRQALASQTVSLLAVDEAHCLSQWGHDFRPDYLHIATFRQEIGTPPTAALTATATPQVQDDIVRLLGLPAAQRLVTGFNRPNLTLEVRYTPSPEDKLRSLRSMFQVSGPTLLHGAAATISGTWDLKPQPCIIYTGTRREAEEVADFVREVCGVPALHYHGGLNAAARTQAQEAFMAGRVPVIVATNAFGLGVDKPDVRAVVHFNLPGTLEAYYQEAGRAGRDGEPALCLLLYAPQDRALQEWFIKNDAPSAQEVEAIHQAVHGHARRGLAMLTLEDLSLATGVAEVPLRVGLSQLESAGALRRLGDEGTRLWLEVGPLEAARLRVAEAEVKARRAHKMRQLARMVAYAEGDTCRRRLILDHFGDHGPADAPRCCDNCLQRSLLSREAEEQRGTSAPLLPGSAAQVGLAILDTVRRLRQGMRREIGQEKLAQILRGSRAKDVQQYGYNRLVYYGRLADYTGAQIRGLITQLIQGGYLKVVGGELPVLRLTPAGEKAIADRIPVPLHLPDQEAMAHKKAVKAAGGTVAYTGELLRQGLTLAQIAAQRGLQESTIYGHLAELIAAGMVEVDAVVPAAVQERVRVAIAQAGGGTGLSAVKALLPEEISYDVIRCVRAALERERLSGGAEVQGSRGEGEQGSKGEGEQGSEGEGEQEEVGSWQLSEEEWTILKCVAAVPGQLPRSGIAKLLVGSWSQRVEAFRLHPLFGQLMGRSRDAVLAAVDRLLAGGLLDKDEHGYVVLTAGGQAALRAHARAAELTAKLQQPFVPTTSRSLPTDRQERVSRIVALGETGSERDVPTLIEALSDADGNIRRLAASALGKLKAREAVHPLLKLLSHETEPQVRQYAIKALGKIGDSRARSTLEHVAKDPQERDYNIKSAQVALKKLKREPLLSLITQAEAEEPDEIIAFLSRSHPRPLPGPWRAGWALDFHSRFAGADWSRTEAGELAYRYKYEGDQTLLEPLADRLVALINQHPQLAAVDAILPVPSSEVRPFDPVPALAEALAQRLGRPVWPDALVKTRQTLKQKELRTLAQKRANVAGAFAVRQDVRGQRTLVLDDLYDSGATLEEVNRVLRAAGAVAVCVLTLTRTIHSEG